MFSGEQVFSLALFSYEATAPKPERIGQGWVFMAICPGARRFR